MATPRKCRWCDRQVRLLKNGKRDKHYVNVKQLFDGYKLPLCYGADPKEGVKPSAATIEESKKTPGKIQCLCCGKPVNKSKDFRPLKHPDYRTGKDCRGWEDNYRR